MSIILLICRVIKFILQKTKNMKVLTKFFFLLLLTCSLSNNLFAQAENSAKSISQFFTAYTTNSIPAWKISLGQLEKATDEASQLLLAKAYYLSLIHI